MLLPLQRWTLFWHPSRIRFLAPKMLRAQNGRKIIESICFCYYSYAFLAPLSDPIFGAEMAPEPKREENNGVDTFLFLQSYTFLAPLSDPIFGSEMAPEPKREENNGIDMFLLSNCLRHIRHRAWVGGMRLRGPSLGSRGMPPRASWRQF